MTPGLIALAIAVVVTVFVTGVSVFSLAAWYVVRRSGWLLLAAFWIVTACSLGYVQVRRYCGQGLTCDVAGVDYLALMWPRFTWRCAVVLGGAAVVVGLRAKRDELLSWRVPFAGLLGALAGSSLVYAALLASQPRH
jgi:hypothetical protein